MTTGTGPTVAQLVAGPAMTVTMDQHVGQILDTMKRRGIRFAAVDQGGRITAVLDRLTLADRLAGRRWLLVRDVVRPGMACLRADASPTAAALLMRITGSAAVPVVDDHHRLIGLVTADALPAAD